MSNLLELKGVSKFYGTGKKRLSALEGISLEIRADKPEIFTIAGESGSGKSTLVNLILGFTRPSEGEVLFDGKSVFHENTGVRKDYYRQVQAVFQDPFGIYNPFYRVRHVFDMAIDNFGLTSSAGEKERMIEDAMNVVGLTGADILRKYPHQLSGGQRQRIMMARAYLIKPRLIVADEPVSMVDASLRAAILDVMLQLRDQQGISFVYITHDLSTAFQVGDRIMMLYQGRVAEQGPAEQVIADPRHPYVRMLVESVPKPDPAQRWQGEVQLPAEEAQRIPFQEGCRYADRCPLRIDRCEQETPQLTELNGAGRVAACFRLDQ